MRLSYLLLCCSVTPGFTQLLTSSRNQNLEIRQQSGGSAFPTLTTGSQSASVTSVASSQQQTDSKSTNPPVTSSTLLGNNGGNNNSNNNTSSSVTSNSASSITSTSVSDAVSTTTSSTSATATPEKTAQPLPLPPKITPALSIAGAILIITGVVYLLIGVKNRLIHVFLSTAYLTSLATLVLVLYVVNPPVKDAIQGAYFVGIFMCGVIFGGGALIFQDITEGLGCLLGGFALSMWFLTLKPGGLLTSLGGKAIFIAAFCVLCWSLSFSHYTRAYGLIGSTSFAGSVALVLGIDCFALAGYKEFWVYLWDLNDNLFPLNTSTYPMTRGIRVELVVVILGTIVGVISQVRLWRLVQDRHKAREAVKAEDERRRDAVEEALGRHLERQNDKDRSEWEKRYGDRLTSKRNTVLWSEAHGDKRLSNISVTEVDSSQNSDSVDSVEMAHIQLTGQKLPVRASKSMKRQSNLVHPILEVEEEAGSQPPTTGEFTRIPSNDGDGEATASPTLRPKLRKPSSKRITARVQQNTEEIQKRSSMQSLSDLKRRSMQSMRPKSRAGSEKSEHGEKCSESVEALVNSTSNDVARSRASSVAATLDEENEELEIPANDEEQVTYQGNRPPQIAISLPHTLDVKDFLHAGYLEPHSPSGISDSFEDDPEAVVRVPKAKTNDVFHGGAGGLEPNGEEVDPSGNSTSQSPTAEGLTKGALDKVPSQLSNVVLSYRTNEWAKHITTAEAPIFEEPDPVTTHDEEEPAHLAPPRSPSTEQEHSESPAVVKPPELPLPVTSVESSETGLKVNPVIQPLEKVSSKAESQIQPTPDADEHVARPASQASMVNASKRSFTDPTQQPGSAAKAPRRMSNPLHRQPPLRTITINEDSATNFDNVPEELYRPTSSASNYALREQYLRGGVSPSPEVYRAMSPAQQYPSAFQRQTPTPTYGYQNYSSPDLRPGTSQSFTPSLMDMAAMRSETRLSSYNNSHQPLQRQNTSDSQRREIMMADWRGQMSRSNSAAMLPFESPEAIQNQLIYDSRMMKAKQEAERVKKAQREAAMDQTMRTQSMIDAHREVMKRMQSQANKTLAK